MERDGSVRGEEKIKAKGIVTDAPSSAEKKGGGAVGPERRKNSRPTVGRGESAFVGKGEKKQIALLRKTSIGKRYAVWSEEKDRIKVREKNTCRDRTAKGRREKSVFRRMTSTGRGGALLSEKKRKEKTLWIKEDCHTFDVQRREKGRG